MLAAELRDLLLTHPCVVAWVNGHTHVHAVTAIRDDGYPGGFWQVTTASHIDWPQQARIIELLETDGGLAIACTVIDSAAPVSYRDGENPPARPAWRRWPASSPPTIGRSGSSSRPTAVRAPAPRRTGTSCSRSSGRG